MATVAGTPPGGGPTVPEPLTDILPIRPPLEIPVGLPVWAWALIAVTVALLGALAWYGYRARTRGSAEGVSRTPPVPAHLLASAELRALDAAAKTLADREYYFRLTAVFKGYLEDRFFRPAREMTVAELLPLLSELPAPPAETLDALHDLLVRAEPVKFAGQAAGNEVRHGDLVLVETGIREIDDAARRREDAEARAAAAAQQSAEVTGGAGENRANGVGGSDGGGGDA